MSLQVGACPKCGGPVESDARFCKHCAFELSHHSKLSIPTPDTTSRTLTWFLVIGLGGLLLGLIVIALFLFRPGDRGVSNVATANSNTSEPSLGTEAKEVQA